MTRRLVLAAGALAAAALLSSCSTVDKPAASVNGATISQATFRDLAEAYSTFKSAVAAQSGTPATASDPGTLSGADARQVLAASIQNLVLDQELTSLGKALTPDQLAAGATAAAAQFSSNWALAPKPLQDLVSRQQALSASIAAALGPSDADTAALYAQGPQASGIACVSHILLADEAAANAALARLKNGEAFADVAKAVSTDTGSAQGGGALTDQSSGSACSTTTSFQGTYDPDFVAGVLAAKVGEPTAPVKTQFGFHIILVRPYAEVQADAMSIAQSAAVRPKVRGFFSTAKISVSPSIGAWSTASNTVVAIDQVSTTTPVVVTAPTAPASSSDTAPATTG